MDLKGEKIFVLALAVAYARVKRRHDPALALVSTTNFSSCQIGKHINSLAPISKGLNIVPSSGIELSKKDTRALSSHHDLLSTLGISLGDKPATIVASRIQSIKDVQKIIRFCKTLLHIEAHKVTQRIFRSLRRTIARSDLRIDDSDTSREISQLFFNMKTIFLYTLTSVKSHLESKLRFCSLVYAAILRKLLLSHANSRESQVYLTNLYHSELCGIFHFLELVFTQVCLRKEVQLTENSSAWETYRETTQKLENERSRLRTRLNRISFNSKLICFLSFELINLLRLLVCQLIPAQQASLVTDSQITNILRLKHRLLSLMVAAEDSQALRQFYNIDWNFFETRNI